MQRVRDRNRRQMPSGFRSRLPLHLLTEERARPERIRNWPNAWWLAVITVCFGAFMGQLDASIVTLTYRPVESDFHATLAQVEWISLAYLLALVALLVPVGKLSDAHGRKLLYLYGFVLFTAASAACGLAGDLPVLLICRAAQAVGAALLQANSVALVTTSAPSGRMRSALGVQAGAQALGLALGPTVGGVVVSAVGWRGVYFINVPVGIIAVIAGYYLLPRTQQRSSAQTFDWWGVGLLGTATTTLLLGVSAVSGLRLPTWADVLMFVVAVASSWAFIVRQRRAPHPLIDIGLLADPVIAWGLAGGLCSYLVLFGPLVLVPVVLTAKGLSALQAGLVLTALPTGFALAAIGTNRLLPPAWSDRWRTVGGSVLACVGLAGGLVIPLDTGPLIPVLAVIGFGIGTFTPSNNATIMSSVPRASAGTGGGLVNMTRGLGTALGVAVVTLGLHLQGPRLAFVVLLAAGAVAAVASWTGHRPGAGPSAAMDTIDLG